jgi:putative tail protein
MSGQQWGTAVGYVVGAYFGNPQLGAVIGGMIGGAIDPTKLSGPRLTDGMQVTAQDGIQNPWGFGTFAVGCNIGNAFDLVEHKHKDDGKGSGVENTTYSYSRSYGLLICRGKRRADGTYDPIAGILRATHNGKVVYNVAPDATTEQLAQNSKFLKKYKFYLGGEDQLPDPTLESYLGVNNVSAYRGQVYMVATDEDQQQHGSIGQWEFVVSMEGAVDPSVDDNYYPGRLAGFVDGPQVLADSEENYNLRGYRAGVEVIGDTIAEILAAFQTSYPPGILPGVRLGYSAYAQESTSPAVTYPYSEIEDQPTIVDNAFATIVFNDFAPDEYVNAAAPDFCPIIPNPGAGSLSPTSYGDTKGVVAWKNGDGVSYLGYPVYVYCIGDDTPAPAVTGPEPVLIQAERKRVGPPAGGPPGSVPMPGLPDYYVTQDGQVVLVPGYVEVAGDFRVLSLASELTMVDDRLQYAYYEQGPALPITSPNYDNETFWTDHYDAAVLAGDLPAGWVYGVDYPTNTDSVFTGAPLDAATLNRDKIVLAEIVAECCRRSGLENSDFDVSQLTDELDGFKVAVETSGEAVISGLMQGFFFDCGEWDDKLRFIKRGGDVVGELTVDDLAERDGPAIEETQVQEVELLRKVSVKAMDPDAGYVETTQVSERRTSTIDAKGEQTLNLAIVADKDTQARIADKRQKVAWSELRRFGLTLPYTLAKYTVTDIVGLTDKKGRRQRVRFMEASEDTGRIDISEAMLDRQNAYTSNVEGVQKSPPTNTSPGLIGPTYFWAGNLPSLRTKDNVPGMYIAACGYLSAWGGAEIQLSTDGGESFQVVATIIQPSTMGSLTANCTDSDEPIEVFMNSGTLSSITETQMANRQNAFAITTGGISELGQFKTATLDTPRNYDLTDIIRGGLGTTPAAHVTGDPFVMVATAIFLPLDISLSGKTLIFKAVSLGTSSDDAEEYPVVFNPLFTSVVIDPYTDDAGSTYTDNAGNIYYYEATA